MTERTSTRWEEVVQSRREHARDQGHSYVPLQWLYGSPTAEGRCDPWRVLVISVLLNQTSRWPVRDVLGPLFARWPTAALMMLADRDEIENAIRPLGLATRRTRTLVEISEELARDPLVDRARVLSLYGCGIYAADSFEIFCLDDLDIEPTDHVLRDWVRLGGVTRGGSPE